MRIYFERSGGFIGLRLRTDVDTARLPSEEAQYWREMIVVTHFFSLPSRLVDEWLPDQFLYRLTVSTSEKEHTVQCSEETAPEPLQPYLRRLTLLARKPKVESESEDELKGGSAPDDPELID